jgi:hypothetical protein
VVQVRSGEGWWTWSPFYGHVFHGAEEEDLAQIPVRDGDLLIYDDELVVLVTASDTGTLVIEGRGSVVTVDGTAVLLDVDTAEGAQWLRTHTAEEMAALRMLTVESDPNEEVYSLLNELSVHNPDLALVVDDEDYLPRLLELFDPSFLLLADVPRGEYEQGLLEREENLRHLFFAPYDRDLSFLSRIPNLEKLTLSEWNPKETGPLPDNLPALKTVWVMGAKMEDLGALGIQPGLEELTLSFCEEGPDSGRLDLSALAGYGSLQILSLTYCPTVVDLSALASLENLEWLGLPGTTTQQQLERIVATHPDLTVLDLVAAERITDITPLGELSKVEGLLLKDGAPAEPLYEMDGLEYLAVSLEEGDGAFIGEEGFARLQTELPNTVVARVDPLCLGSGFILLLVPLLTGAWWVARGRPGRMPASRHA